MSSIFQGGREQSIVLAEMACEAFSSERHKAATIQAAGKSAQRFEGTRQQEL